MGRAKKARAALKPVSTEVRKLAALETARGGIQKTSSELYEKKWKGFKEFCRNENLQGSNGTIDPDGDGQPSEDIIGNIVEYFHFRVLEEGCDPGEPINVRSALASEYKRKFGRVGEWKVNKDGNSSGTPSSSIEVKEAASFYKREKKKKVSNGHCLSDSATCPSSGIT